MDLISVIVPVYKVEKYLDRCVESIVNQTYKNLEIILVDDGSPDNCPAMCDAWAKKDNRIKVIHKANGGLSDARNAGMAVAVGEYMGFVDSDDYIAPEMYQLLLERIVVDGSDMAACGVEMVYEDDTAPKRLTSKGSCVLDRISAMEAVIRESWLKQPVWYKLYKTELVHDILFPVGKYHEDVFWTWQAVAKAEKVSVFDMPCYYYVQRSGSIMSNVFSMNRLDALEGKINRLKYIQEHILSLKSIAKEDLLFSSLYMGQMSLLHMAPKEQRKAFEVLYTSIKTYSLTNAEIMSLPFKQRLWATFGNISFKTTCKLRNYLHIGV